MREEKSRRRRKYPDPRSKRAKAVTPIYRGDHRGTRKARRQIRIHAVAGFFFFRRASKIRLTGLDSRSKTQKNLPTGTAIAPL